MLAAGEVWTLRFEVRVDDGALAGDQVVNQAGLQADELGQLLLSDDPRLPGGPQATVVEIGRSGTVQVLKAVQPTEAVLGDEVTWTLELLSTLNGAAVLRLQDVLPEGVEYVAGSLSLDALRQHILKTKHRCSIQRTEQLKGPCHFIAKDMSLAMK